MRRGIYFTIAGCLAFVALVLALFVSAIMRQAPPSNDVLRDMGAVVLPEPRELGAFELTTATGARFDRQDLTGQWTLLYFGFTSCPDICPTTLATLARARSSLLEQSASVAPYRVALVSIDPQRDTAERLQAYVDAFSDAFVGVRGEREALVELTEQVGVTFAQVPADHPDGYTMEHSSQIVVIDPQGRYRAYIKRPLSVKQINETYRALVSRG